VTATATTVALPARIRLADGRVYDGPLARERHQRVQLGLLHADSRGYLEVCPGPRPRGGKVEVDRRRRREHYVPTGSGPEEWMGAALEHIAAIERGECQNPSKPTFDPPREEVFFGVTPRNARKANKQYVEVSRWLWVDVDQPDELHRLWAFTARYPAHLVVMSGGSGGAHAYWRLDPPLAATTVNPDTGEIVEWIERANQRIIHHLGRWTTVTEDGAQKRRFIGADRACADRSKVMRVAGTINHKSGEHARIAWADFALAAYDAAQLIGHLPDMPATKATGRVERRQDAWGRDSRDPYRDIAPSDYFLRLAAITLPQYGNVSCPHAHHEDRDPSCRVGGLNEGWLCHGCGAGGGIYDLASAVAGGPTRQALRGEAFRQAAARVREVYGNLR
jgi:hypothetical protein